MGTWRDQHGLHDAIAGWMRDGGESVTVAAGERADARISGTLCLLAEGWMVRSRPLAGARAATLATYLPGDIVMLDVWSGAPDGDELRGLTKSQLICRPTTDFERALEANPDMAHAVIRRQGQEAGLLREALAAVSRMDAQERLVVYFNQTHRRLVEGGSLAADDRRFTVPMTQSQLADAIGITNVHVNRILGVLKRDGLLTFAAGEVDVIDWPEFERLGRSSVPDPLRGNAA